MDSRIIRTNAVFSDYNRQDTPGCALSIIEEENIIYKQGYGMANLEHNIPITPSTIFHVASVSKQFTAMAIAILANEGKLSLDDDIHKHLPEIHEFDNKIHISHLIHHISGIRDQWSLLTLSSWRMEDIITMDDIFELLKAQRELNFKPGAEYIYCNSGYTLMAMIVERVSGKAFPDYCWEQIFKPLGMRNTHFHLDHKQIVKNRADSYELDKNNNLKKSVLSYANVGATSLFTTVEDMALWDRNFYTAKVGGPEVISMMHTQGILNDGRRIRYAYGVNIGKYRGLKIVEHSGSDAGFRSNILRFPDQKSSIIVLGNLSTINASQLCKKVADIWLENQFLEYLPKLEPIVKIEPESLESLAGIYHNPTLQATYVIFCKEGKLYAQPGRNIELTPLSKERFKSPQYSFDTIIEFKPTQTLGKKELHFMISDEPAVIYHEVEPYEPGEEELTQYTGTYYSPELDIRYYILLEEGKLQLKRIKYGKTPLIPSFKDTFTVGNNEMRFVRDEDYEVTGFKITTGRVRNLGFIKMD